MGRQGWARPEDTLVSIMPEARHGKGSLGWISAPSAPQLGTSYRAQATQQIVVALGGLKEQQGGLSVWSPVREMKVMR